MVVELSIIMELQEHIRTLLIATVERTRTLQVVDHRIIRQALVIIIIIVQVVDHRIIRQALVITITIVQVADLHITTITIIIIQAVDLRTTIIAQVQVAVTIETADQTTELEQVEADRTHKMVQVAIHTTDMAVITDQQTEIIQGLDHQVSRKAR